MNARLATTLLIAALLVPASAYADTKALKESIKENVSDSVITTRIKAEYARDKDVSARSVIVDTDDRGVVTLRGTARSRAEADKAVKIARETQGVSSVKNEITVQAR